MKDKDIWFVDLDTHIFEKRMIQKHENIFRKYIYDSWWKYIKDKKLQIIDDKKKTLMKVVNTDRIYMRHIIARILHISQLKKNLLSIGCFWKKNKFLFLKTMNKMHIFTKTEISVKYIKTNKQLTDSFTKTLSKEKC